MAAATGFAEGPPLGAHWDGTGTRFSLFSAHATAVELCLFDRPEATAESKRIALEKKKGGIWTVYLSGAAPGTLYGYRVSGPFTPQDGHRFNPFKLLVDPYARALTGEPVFGPSLFGYAAGRDPDLSFEGSNSAGIMPKSVVIDPRFDWQGVSKPIVSWSDTVIYEAHLKGLTRLHPQVPPEHRGKYLGLAAPPVIDHLKRLGVTTVELLPLCQFASEEHLAKAGRVNYWGYSPLAFFAPHAAYASGSRGEQVGELKTLVRELHRHGLEVVVDMVFNHSVEGGAGGPTLSFRGIDNKSYYRLEARNPRRYVDHTGCGNTLDIGKKAFRRLVLDALRYWAADLQVDGFRLDLATTLGRDRSSFDGKARLFAEIAADPQLAGLKFIAEPWDLGPGGYQLGAFPVGWAEWNDRYRNGIRRFWRGEANGGASGELARRLAGSADLFPARAPLASINYVCSHDGFTLADLVSYERKHNEANGEDNRDGTNDNLSRNWGSEGPTDDLDTLARRRRARTNLVASLAISLGVPMICHGDEIGRSQSGNNNPYCQDNATTWVDWRRADWDFCRQLASLLAMRRRHSILRNGSVWQDAGLAEGSPGSATVRWFGLRGERLTEREWSSPDHATFGFHLEPPRGKVEDGILVLINGSRQAANFRLPASTAGRRVTLLLYSAWPVTPNSSAIGLTDWTAEGLSMVIFAVGRPFAEGAK